MTWGPIEQEVKQGEALFQNDEIEEALALFDSILKKSPGHVPALNNKGVALNRLGKHQDAEETFWKVLAIDENNADAVYNLVLNYVQGEQLNRVDQILKDYGHTLSESDIQGITGAIEEIFQKANLPPPPDQHQNRPSPIKEEKEMEWCATKLNLNLDILAPKDTSLKDKYAIGTRLLLLMKTNLIRSADAKYHKFLGAYKNVEAHTLLDFDRAFILYQTALSTSHLNGCSAECGVFRGGSSALIADIEPTRKHYALDTYEGFPDMFTDVDLHESGNFSDVSYEDIQALFSSHSNIVILKGRFDESFHMIRNEVFSFIHIDSDLYASTLECIEFFYPRMLPGGIILFDDYLIPDTPGVKKAVDEFFREKREHPVILPTFQAMVIKSI